MNCGDIDLGCGLCRLSKGRTQVVPGTGSCSSKIAFVGEAPGKDEDAKGKPFVGRAGRLLDEALRDCGVRRESVYISNLVKCRPPGNRMPRKDEIATCARYIESEIRDLSPKVVCALGQTAAERITGKKVKMSKVVGRRNEVMFAGKRLVAVVSYHPAACLYQRKYATAFKRSIRSAVVAAGLA